MYKTMHNLKNRSKDKKGFTLAELLIVVAIIAVLVAIAIPVFTGQLEKAREAADMANIRATYAEACLAALESEDGTASMVTPPMVSKGAFTEVDSKIIGGVELPTTLSTLKAGDTITVSVASDGTPSFAITPTTP